MSASACKIIKSAGYYYAFVGDQQSFVTCLFLSPSLIRSTAIMIYIQGVHKVRVHFKKIITLIVFAIEIICKKDLKEENRYFLRFY